MAVKLNYFMLTIKDYPLPYGGGFLLSNSKNNKTF